MDIIYDVRVAQYGHKTLLLTFESDEYSKMYEFIDYVLCGDGVQVSIRKICKIKED